MRTPDSKYLLNKNKILVVEDEDVCLHVIRTFLEEAGANVDGLTNAEDAIEKLCRKQYDLVLSDIKLPGKSGIDLLEFIKKNSIDVPVMLVTGHMDLNLAVDALRLGAQDYLLKPLSDSKYLVESVGRIIKNHKLQRKVALLQQKVRHHEKILSLVCNKIKDALFMYELDKGKVTAGKIIKMNNAAVNMLALRGEKEVKTLLISDFIALEYQHEFEEHLKRVVKNRNDAVETTLRSTNGNNNFVEMVSTLIVDGDNYYVVSSARDASARIAFEKQIADSSEKIRSQLAHELHDAVSQDISSISILSACLKKKLKKANAPTVKDAESLEFLSQRALLSIRRMLFNLFPADIEKMELPEILEHLAATEERLFKINCRFECIGEIKDDETIKKHIYRIAQEAVANARRHSNASEIVIKLFPENGLNVLSIEDNGCGIRKTNGKNGMGLCIMRHRARIIGAKLDIVTQKNKGTVVICKWKPRNE